MRPTLLYQLPIMINLALSSVVAVKVNQSPPRLLLLMVNTTVSIAVVVAETSSTLAMSSYTVPQSNP